MRTGIGYDIHRLIPTVEKTVISLGGTEVPCYFKLKAHSDGDVLLHAICDACLGALALGDIGQWFPDTKPENRGRKSSEFVRPILAEVRRLGWRIAHVDSIVLAEEPRIAPHSETIRQGIASLLGIELSAVSVKAKTMEGLGPIGERKAIAAHAAVTLEKA